jgi:hypothetical protein
MSEPLTLRFVHRFRSGTLGTLTFYVAQEGIVKPPHCHWNGPIPKFRGEREQWELSCWRNVVNRFGVESYYVMRLNSGELKAWRCRPGAKPQRVTMAELLMPPIP